MQRGRGYVLQLGGNPPIGLSRITPEILNFTGGSANGGSIPIPSPASRTARSPSPTWRPATKAITTASSPIPSASRLRVRRPSWSSARPTSSPTAIASPMTPPTASAASGARISAAPPLPAANWFWTARLTPTCSCRPIFSTVPTPLVSFLAQLPGP